MNKLITIKAINPRVIMITFSIMFIKLLSIYIYDLRFWI